MACHYAMLAPPPWLALSPSLPIATAASFRADFSALRLRLPFAFFGLQIFLHG